MNNSQITNPPHGGRYGRRRRQSANPAWLTIAAALDAYPFSRSAIYDGLKSGRFRAKKDGTRTLIEVASLEAAIEALPDFAA